MRFLQHPAFRIGAAFLVVLALGVQPDWLPVLNDLRQAGASTRLTVEAYNALQDAYQRQPWQPQRATSAGMAALAIGDYEAARSAIEAAAESGGWTPELRIALGDAHNGAGDTEQAIHEWETAQPERLADTALLYRLARAYEAAERYAQAAAALRALVDLQPEDAVVRYRYGVVLSVLNPSSAQQHLVRAADMDPSVAPFAESLNNAIEAGLQQGDRAYTFGIIGYTLIGLSEYPLARAALTRALEEQPDFAEAYAYLGLAEDQLGGDGLPSYQKALDIDDQVPLTHYLIGLHYRRTGDDAQAIASLKKAFELDPSNAAAAAELGSAYAQAADLPAAELWYRQAVQVAPEDASFWMLLAKFYTEYDLKVDGDGLMSAERAVELAPDSAETLDVLGFAQYLNANYAEAEQNLTRALQLDPQMASAHFHLGLIYLETQRPDLARQSLNNAIGLDTSGPTGGPIAERAVRALTRLGPVEPTATPAP